MPSYVFKCKKCEHKQSALQKFDDPPPKCEKCESETERAIAKSTFVLKGKGWFNTGGY